MRSTPQQAAEKWARKLGQATTDIQNGVQRVQQAPGVSAAAAQQKWINKINESAANGKWADRVSSVPLGTWQQAMINKGLPRIASGAQAAQPKMQAFMQQWGPYVDSVAAQVKQMPNNTIEDGIARAAAQIRGNAQFKRQ